MERYINLDPRRAAYFSAQRTERPPATDIAPPLPSGLLGGLMRQGPHFRKGDSVATPYGRPPFPSLIYTSGRRPISAILRKSPQAPRGHDLAVVHTRVVKRPDKPPPQPMIQSKSPPLVRFDDRLPQFDQLSARRRRGAAKSLTRARLQASTSGTAPPSDYIPD